MAWRKTYMIISLICMSLWSVQCDLTRFEAFQVPHASFRLNNNNCAASCDPGFINLSSNANTYLWEFGDGDTTGRFEVNPRKKYEKDNIYPVKLIAFGDNNLRDDTTILVTIHPAMTPDPIAKFSLTNDSCHAPCDPGFVNESLNATQFLWLFGDGARSESTDPQHTYQTAQLYEVILRALNGGGDRHDTTMMVTILETDLTVASFSVETDLDECPAPCWVSFTNTSERAQSYSWNFDDPDSGNDNISTLTHPRHRFNEPGTYNVQLTANGQRNTDVTQEAITIREWQCGDPIIDIRDSISYQTIWIDEMGGHDLEERGTCWMVDNLQFDASFSTCYDMNLANCEEYGKMYDHLLLSDFCPNGWELASNSDWDQVLTLYGLSKTPFSGGFAYLGSMDFILDGGISGLEVKLGGTRSNNNYENLNEATAFWTQEKQIVDFRIINVTEKSGEAFLNNLSVSTRDAYMRCVQK